MSGACNPSALRNMVPHGRCCYLARGMCRVLGKTHRIVGKRPDNGQNQQ